MSDKQPSPLDMCPDVLTDADFKRMTDRAIAGDPGATKAVCALLAYYRAGRHVIGELYALERVTGAEKRADQARAKRASLHAWADPLFADAHLALRADGKLRIGRDALALRAKRIAAARGIEEAKRKLLTTKAAREYLEAKRQED